MGEKYRIVVEVDLGSAHGNLHNFTDEYLVQLFHLSQMNPAPFGDPDAGRFADSIRHEIVRRWLEKAPTERYQHQKSDFHFNQSLLVREKDPSSGQCDSTEAVRVRPYVVETPNG